MTETTLHNYTRLEQKQHRAELIYALLSGEYKQNRNSLKDWSIEPDGEKTDAFHCCLGVACDISGLGKWVGEDDDIYLTMEPYEDRNTAIMPEAVRDYYGFRSSTGELDSGETLTSLNDTEGINFTYIAYTIALAEMRDESAKGLLEIW